MNNNLGALMSRKDLARFLSVGRETLAIWKSTQKYNLRFIKIGNRIFYRLADINKFIGVDENETDVEPLLDRKSAAKYLSKIKPTSPNTLAVWDCTKRYDLKPIKIGERAVRYRRAELDKFLYTLLQPF